MTFELKPIPHVWLVLDRGRLSVVTQHNAPQHTRGNERKRFNEAVLQHRIDWASLATDLDTSEARGA